jgi:3D (Asp-Asp-Asp) domain-containing protein
MKKFISLGLVAAASIYYASLPFVVAQADITSFGATSTADATTGTSAGTTIEIPALSVATETVVSTISMRITAYASVPDETDNTPFTTADGTQVGPGEVASNILPFGTRIEIPSLFGDEIFTVHDRMSPRIKNTIDIWMPSVHEALFFGAEHAKVVVLAPPATSTTGLAVAN